MFVIMMLGYVIIDIVVEVIKIGVLNFLEKFIVLQKLLIVVEQGLLCSKEKLCFVILVVLLLMGFVGVMFNFVVVGMFVVFDCIDINGVLICVVEGGGMQFLFDMLLCEVCDLFECVYFEYYLQCEGGSMICVVEKIGFECIYLYCKFKQLGVEFLCNKGELVL